MKDINNLWMQFGSYFSQSYQPSMQETSTLSVWDVFQVQMLISVLIILVTQPLHGRGITLFCIY